MLVIFIKPLTVSLIVFYFPIYYIADQLSGIGKYRIVLPPCGRNSQSLCKVIIRIVKPECFVYFP